MRSVGSWKLRIHTPIRQDMPRTRVSRWLDFIMRQCEPIFVGIVGDWPMSTWCILNGCIYVHVWVCVAYTNTHTHILFVSWTFFNFAVKFNTSLNDREKNGILIDSAVFCVQHTKRNAKISLSAKCVAALCAGQRMCIGKVAAQAHQQQRHHATGQ